ncbi:methyltransferase domain-containing protein [uncultured Roseobacter sp.]|uniref:methyltransferase domain-containing protein n=1 Tax=uncultured Roseobacter sp. TaxID=114847 RepID=UPI002606833F|nr:methyltransferase domain-containing protein [uncultured Roseobacter sp.]
MSNRTKEMLAETPISDAVDLYDKLAPRYDKLHHRWLRHAGGEAQAALEGLVRALATPNSKFLDAGCGTGNLARALIAEGMPPNLMTLLDPSAAMLARCADIPVPKIQGRLESLPFENGTFDLVTCAWVLETVPDPYLALTELCRVVRAGGALCLAFCADEPARGLADSLMRQALLFRGTGRFMSRSRLMQAIERFENFEVRAVPSHGPASTLLARRSGAATQRLGSRA